MFREPRSLVSERLPTLFLLELTECRDNMGDSEILSLMPFRRAEPYLWEAFEVDRCALLGVAPGDLRLRESVELFERGVCILVFFLIPCGYLSESD